MSADYVELAGRRIREDVARWVYIVTGIATDADDTVRPTKGDVLAATGHTIDPICQSVDIDELRYPGRYVFTSIFEAPMTRAEFVA